MQYRIRTNDGNTASIHADEMGITTDNAVVLKRDDRIVFFCSAASLVYVEEVRNTRGETASVE